MTSSLKKSPPNKVNYPPDTIKRGKEALICSPFQLNLFITMINRSVDLKDIALSRGLERNYTVKGITENKVEKELIRTLKKSSKEVEVSKRKALFENLRRKITLEFNSESEINIQGYFDLARWVDNQIKK